MCPPPPKKAFPQFGCVSFYFFLFSPPFPDLVFFHHAGIRQVCHGKQKQAAETETETRKKKKKRKKDQKVGTISNGSP